MSPPSVIDPSIGAKVGGYRIEALIGRGGMGVVYRAQDLRLERPVALKVLAPELSTDELFRKRFLRESRLAASVDHPNVVPVYEAGAADGALFIAMRFVEGTDLRDVLEREGPLDPERTLTVLDQVAAALDAAHRRGLFHRDVKPENVLLGEGEHVYLTDFGLSMLTSSTSSLTPTGQLLGTVDYVAPEKIEGRELDPAAGDVYALGCILVECLTGDPPYPRDTTLAALWAHVQDEPPSVSSRRPELPDVLDDVAAQALAKEPAARFRSCGAFMAATRDAFAGIAAAPPFLAPAETRRVVTILAASVSVSSSAPGARLDPETVRRVAGRCLEAMEATIERHGGLAERLAGDGLLAVFGYPAAREDDALRAVSAALEVRERVAQVTVSTAADVGAQIAVRVGVEAGEVVAGQSVTEVAGEPVQVAVGLERAAQAGEVLVGRDVHALLRGAAAVQALDGEEGGALRLVGLGPERPTREPRSPMVGRDHELVTLCALYEQAVEERRCRLGIVLGPPGIGKTRLALELASTLEGSCTVLRGRCLSYGDGITYWPVNEIVRAAVGEDIRAGLERVLEGEEDQILVAERVEGAIGLTEGTWGGEETFWAIRRLFETLAKRRPLLLIVEDVHWAEPTLVELIEHLSAWTRDAPIFVLALARTELLDELPESLTAAAALTIELNPLAEADACALVESQAAGAAGLQAEVIGNIMRTAEGNPLFLEQLLAMAAEDPQHGRRMSLPPAIHALFAARLDRLSPEERRVLECGAVEGIVFHVGPLAELCPEIGAVAIGRHLLALSRKQLVQPDRAFPGDEALRFRHGLIREAAYESLTQERRALLHERFASVLERVATDRSLEESGFIGYHLEQAVRYRTELGTEPAAIADLSARSAFFLAAAGRSAVGRGDFSAAATLLERAAALLPLEDQERALVEIDLSAALLEGGRLAKAETVAAAVETRMAGNPRVSANASAQRLLVRYSIDLGAAVEELGSCGDDIRRVFEAESDDRGLYRLLHLRGLVYWAEGLVARAQEAWEQATVHAARAVDRVAHVDLLCWLASAAFFGPTSAPAGVRQCEAILDQVRDQPYARARVLHPLAGLHAMAGRFRVANDLLAEANAILGELGLTMQFAVSHPEVLVAMLEGDLDRAESRLREGYERLEGMGERNLLSTTAAMLARVALERGRLDDALRYAEHSGKISATEDVWNQAVWRGVKARILARHGATEQAQKLAREAVAIIGRTDYLRSQGDALADLADVLCQVGDIEDALEAGRQAGVCYERKGDDVSAARIRTLMEKAEQR